MVQILPHQPTLEEKLQRSPILSLDEAVFASPSMLSPELADALQGILDKHDLQAVIVDEPKFGFRLLLDTHQICVPIAAMEYLWSLSLQFWIVSQEYVRAQQEGHESLDPAGNVRLRSAARLVDWARSNLENTGKDRWPIDLPKPEQDPDDDDRKVANELFLGAVGWIILHEIGHADLEHAEFSGSYSQQQERDADLFATACILDPVTQSAQVFNKRIFCVAVALLCLQSFETSAAPRWGADHPPAHERIDYCLANYRAHGIEQVTAFMVVCLQVLFAGTEVSPDVDGASFSAILDDLLFEITRRNAEGRPHAD